VNQRNSGPDPKCARLVNVPTLTLKPEHFRGVQFDPVREASIRVEASKPIDIYVVSENDYPEFSARHNLYTARYPQKTQFETSLSFGPEARNRWYLVFENRSPDIAAVHYRVFD
jgi:hypothetical protein